jgi:uncharacterized membrane protein
MANFHAIAGSNASPAHPLVRKIGPADLKEALIKGVDDFKAMPSHVFFLGLIYPISGICLAALTSTSNGLHLLFPLMSGFALVGPFAAIGLYEISRRRELGLEVAWTNAFDVLRSPAVPSILTLGLVLMLIFIAWLGTAESLYKWLFGAMAPESYTQFLTIVLTTSRGWTLIILGASIGFVFAVVVLSISVVSFPLLLDRNGGVAEAIRTSIRTVLANPMTMALWGLIVVVALVLGSLPVFIGLAVVTPILAHATWHLYRKAVLPQ